MTILPILILTSSALVQDPARAPRATLEIGAPSRALAASGDWLLAGVHGYDDPETSATRALALAFQRSTHGWRCHSVLRGPTRAERSRTQSLATDGATTVIGLGGSRRANADVLVFERHVDTWALVDVLGRGRSGGRRPIAGSVAVEGNTLVVGYHNYPNKHGSADIYERSDGRWTLVERIHGEETHRGLGASVAVASNDVLVAARCYWRADEHNSVRVFRKEGGCWSLARVLSDPSTPRRYRTGFATDLSAKGKRLAIKATENIYGYERSRDGWRRDVTLPSNDYVTDEDLVNLEDFDIAVTRGALAVAAPSWGVDRIQVFEKSASWARTFSFEAPKSRVWFAWSGRSLLAANDTELFLRVSSRDADFDPFDTIFVFPIAD